MIKMYNKRKNGMNMEQYEDFFKEIKKFLENQKLQKIRGLNDFNLLTSVRDPHEEVGLHSRFLYSLIDINGKHYQDDLFVGLFVENVLDINIKDFGKVIKVNREDLTEKNRRIDFTIESEKYLIGIEMKIEAQDQDKQIYDYAEALKKRVKKNKTTQDVIIYYLTLFGDEASNESSNGIEYKTISFKEHILNWINECQKEVGNITNLNFALESYKEIVKDLIGNKEEKVISLEEKILKEKFEIFLEICDDENYQSFSENKYIFEKIKQIYPNVCKLKWKTFLNDLLNDLSKRLENKKVNFEREDEKSLDVIVNEQYIVRILIVKPEECKNNEIKLQVANRINPFSYDMKEEILETIRNQLKSQEIKLIPNGARYYGYIKVENENVDDNTLKDNIIKKLHKIINALHHNP